MTCAATLTGKQNQKACEENVTEIFTQCPYCQTSFKISESHLRIADGIVRCGACLETFSGPEYIVNPNESPLPGATENNDWEIIGYSEPKPDANIAIEEEKEDDEYRQPLTQLEDNDSLEILQAEEISAIHEAPIDLTHPLEAPAAKRRRAGQYLLLVGLLLALAGQYLWSNFAVITQAPRWNPVAQIVCQALTCPEKEAFDLAQFVTEELIVRSHPVYANALQIDFIFSNEAAFAQSFPLAELSFTDTSGRLLANRQFTPSEYLPPDLRQLTQMPAKARVQTSFEILDPGQGAINYSLNFNLNLNP